MPIADLALRANYALEAESTSVPDNGVNTFGVGIARVNMDNEDSLEILIEPQVAGGSVTDWDYVPASLNLTIDPPEISMTFVQAGADAVRVIVRQRHTGTK